MRRAKEHLEDTFYFKEIIGSNRKHLLSYKSSFFFFFLAKNKILSRL